MRWGRAPPPTPVCLLKKTCGQMVNKTISLDVMELTVVTRAYSATSQESLMPVDAMDTAVN